MLTACGDQDFKINVDYGKGDLFCLHEAGEELGDELSCFHLQVVRKGRGTGDGGMVTSVLLHGQHTGPSASVVMFLNVSERNNRGSVL